MLYGCMYGWMYVCMDVCMDVCVHGCVWMCAWMCVLDVCMDVHGCVWMYVHGCMCMANAVCMYVCILCVDRVSSAMAALYLSAQHLSAQLIDLEANTHTTLNCAT